MDKIFLFAIKKRKLQFAYSVTVMIGQTSTPKFTFVAGAPVAEVDWGDGTTRSAVTSGTELTHTYSVAGTYKVTLIMNQQEKYLQRIDINSDKLISILIPLLHFPALTFFDAHTNAAWTQDLSDWQLPPILRDLYIGATQITGSVSNWIIPAAMVNYSSYSTKLTGCPLFSSAVLLGSYTFANSGLPQVTVDLHLARLVARMASMTATYPNIQLTANDAAPSAAGLADKMTLTTAGWTVGTA